MVAPFNEDSRYNYCHSHTGRMLFPPATGLRFLSRTWSWPSSAKRPGENMTMVNENTVDIFRPGADWMTSRTKSLTPGFTFKQ